MNQPLFKQTSFTPPADYQPAGVAFRPFVPQTFTPHYKNHLNVEARPEIMQNKPSNFVNFRGQQAQSYIFPNQNGPVDRNRPLKLQSYARKVSFQEQNNASQEVQPLPNARLNHSIERTLEARQPSSHFTNNLTHNNKKPLFASQMLNNQNFYIDLNAKKNQPNQIKVPRHFPPRQQVRRNEMRGEMRLSLNSLQPEGEKKQSITDRENTVVIRSNNYMNFIGSNLKYRQISYNQPVSNSFGQPNDQFSQHAPNSITSSKNNLTTLDSTQNSSQSHSFNQEQIRGKDLPSSSIQKVSPINYWPLSISPCQQKTHIFAVPPTAVPSEIKVQGKDKNEGNAQFKKKKPLQFLNQSKRRNAEHPVKNFTLNDFELLDKIGKGSFGDVYMAQEKLTGFLVVIKKLLKKKMAEMKVEQHILRQIKIQSFLKHRHLTSLYGFFSDESYVYLILQIMPDGSIMQVKKTRKISESQTSSYIRQICEGLKYMHTEEIIHRDIKPQNVFLNDGYAKIGDFGCSIYTQSLRNTIIGSLAYISPEQLKNASYDEKIDVWSLGVMAYEMMIGKSPHQEDIIKIAKKQIAPQLSQLKFPTEIQLSSEAKDFLISTLNLDPNVRIGIAQALKHDFIKKYLGKQENVSN